MKFPPLFQNRSSSTAAQAMLTQAAGGQAKARSMFSSMTRAVKKMANKWSGGRAVSLVPPARPQALATTPLVNRPVMTTSRPQAPTRPTGGAPAMADPIQRVAMPANPRQPAATQFPHAIHYGYVPSTARSGPVGLSSHEFCLGVAQALQSRQGVLEWTTGPEGGGLVAEIQGRLAGGDVQIADTTVHALEEQTGANGVRRFSALVTAPSQDRVGDMDTFRVPFTLCTTPADQPNGLARTHRAAAVMGDHVARVDWAYQDSVETPLVIGQGAQGLGELSVLSAEVMSQTQAGFANNRQELEVAVNSAARRISPAAAQLAHGTLDVVDGLDRLRTHLQQNLRWIGGEVLAAKRHLPADSFAAPVPQSPVVASTSAPTGSGAAHVVRPSHTQAPAAPGPVRHPRVLSLEGFAPLTTQPTEQAAFRQPPVSNHCGVAAINAFFQAEVITPAQAVNQVLDLWGAVFAGPAGLESLGLPGMMTPKILQAMRAGRTIVVDRETFVGERAEQIPEGYEALYMDTPAEQWRTLENYLQDWQWASPGQHSIAITPDLWLSANLGLHLDQASAIINSLLATKADDPVWHDYPDAIAPISLHEPRVFADLEQRIERAVESRRAKGLEGHFPIVCMVTGHYFTLARTVEGDWLKLGSDGTAVTGLQQADIFAKRGGLSDRLQGVGAIHLVCEALPENQAGTTLQPSVLPQRSTGALAAQSFMDYTQGAPLPALHSPRILNAISRDEVVTLTKTEAMASLGAGAREIWGFLTEGRASPEQQWRAAVNLCAAQAKGLNWVDNQHQLNQIQSIQITPAQWVELQESMGFGPIINSIQSSSARS